MRSRRTVANVLRVLKRARKAEQIAQLEQAIAERQRAIEARNQELEMGITALTRTLQSVTSSREGGYERIHLPTGHALWPVLQQLWHFLDRWQQHRQAEALVNATIRSSTELIQALEAAQPDQPIHFPMRRNTPIDGIIIALMNKQQRGRNLSDVSTLPPYPNMQN